MKIEIKSIDPASMRYPTAGDWEWLPDGSLLVTVPNYGGQELSGLLVAIHEIVEAVLCRRDGITDEEVTRFDTENPTIEEPGDEPAAPYHKQHVIAMAIERDAAIAWGIDWDKHNQWVTDAGNEVERLEKAGELGKSRILREGSRFWAELHLYGLRADDACIPFGDMRYWLDAWLSSLPFDGCPCEAHLKEWMANNPPTFGEFFAWGVRLHNAVNERIFKPQISVENARTLWCKKHL
jgi:hypothetical protein